MPINEEPEHAHLRRLQELHTQQQNPEQDLHSTMNLSTRSAQRLGTREFYRALHTEQ